MNIIRVFKIVLLSHLLEHILQIVEIYVLNIPRTYAMGLIGIVFPFLMKNEGLHLGFAVYQVIGSIYIKEKYRIKSKLWEYGIYLSIFHLTEHISLFILANYMGISSPKTLIQEYFNIGRAELHLLYNLISASPLLMSKVTSIYKEKWKI